MEIRGFRHKGLERLYKTGDPRGMSTKWMEKIRAMLTVIEEADAIAEMGRFPGWKLHPLKGSRKGAWAMWITGNMRLTFVVQTKPCRNSISRTTIEERAMKMKNPSHPGDVIAWSILEPLDLSVAQAAEILGVRRATLSDLVNGKSALSPEMAYRIHKAFGPDPDHLMRIQAAYEMAQFRSRGAKDIKIRRYTRKAA